MYTAVVTYILTWYTCTCLVYSGNMTTITLYPFSDWLIIMVIMVLSIFSILKLEMVQYIPGVQN